jgi:hypothetical protein
VGKSSRNISDSNVSDDVSFDNLSLGVPKLENALCNQDKLLHKVFHENKKLNLELENSFSEIASLVSVHDDMSAKPCDNCNMIMVNYADLGLMRYQVASQLNWNSESSKLVPYCFVLALVFLFVDPIWRLLPLRLMIISTKLIILLTTVFYPLHANCVALSRVSFTMLPKGTPS